MDLKFKENLLNSLNIGLEEVFTHYNTRIDTIQNELINTNASLAELQEKYTTLETNYNELKEDYEAYKSVSLVKNLNSQIFDKNNEIEILNKNFLNYQKSPEPNQTRTRTKPEPNQNRTRTKTEPELEPNQTKPEPNQTRTRTKPNQNQRRIVKRN